MQHAQGPHSHILLTGGGGRGIFWGSEILAKRDFFGSMKDAGFFFGREKTRGSFWVLYFSSAQVNNDIK